LCKIGLAGTVSRLPKIISFIKNILRRYKAIHHINGYLYPNSTYLPNDGGDIVVSAKLTNGIPVGVNYQNGPRTLRPLHWCGK
jgi:hypothetical protein